MSYEMLEIHININNNIDNFNPEKANIFLFRLLFLRFINSWI